MGWKKRSGPKKDPALRANKPVQVYLPQAIYDILKAKAEKRGLPMSRLVGYAVDNELVSGEDFAFPCDEPKTAFVPDSYVEEGGRVYRYIRKFGPMSIDQLVLARRDIGVPEKHAILLGIRELLMRGTLVDMVYPSWSDHKYPPEYKVIAVKRSEDEKKQSEIQKLEQQLQKLKGGGIYGRSIGEETSNTEDSE